MKLFGLTITRQKERQKALHAVDGWRDGWRRILEPFSGAWQQNIEEKRGDLLTYPTLYACIMRISTDIGKLPFTLRQTDDSGVKKTVSNPAYDPVLRKPNQFQTAAQFREGWCLSKLIQGNTYVLKSRDARGVVTELLVLDPCRVLPMVSDSGAVYYQINSTGGMQLPGDYPAPGIVVPASEIIHDRCVTLHHPLIGVPPLAAAHWPALKNMKILRSSTDFFANSAQPGGILSMPAGMNEEDADLVRKFWDENFTGQNAGRVAVIGSDAKFTSFAMKSIDSQMVEQMRYSDEQVCQPFGVPPFIVGIGQLPSGMGVDGLYLMYYNGALQTHIEHMEALLDEGLRVSTPLGIELDLEPLLRMDEAKRAEVETKLVGGKIKTPDEGRLRFNLPATGGGDTLWGQHQDYPLGVLAAREDLNPAPEAAPAIEPEGEDEPSETTRALRGFEQALQEAEHAF